MSATPTCPPRRSTADPLGQPEHLISPESWGDAGATTTSATPADLLVAPRIMGYGRRSWGPRTWTHSGELDRLAEEQAALREIATVLARGAPPDQLFATVAKQVARVLHVPVVSIVRYENEETATECASYSVAGELFAVGSRWSLDGTNVVRMVLDTRAARINDYTGLDGQIAELVRGQGIQSTGR